MTGIPRTNLMARYEVEPIPLTAGMFLGSGTYGEVTSQQVPNQPKTRIALKQFSSSTALSSFVREVESLVQLRHPCIVRFLGWSRRDSHSTEIQTKLATNGTLSDYLSQGARASLGLFLDATRQGRLICDIVMGMKYVHSRGFMHRDLKPSNILLDEDWRGVICDFGLSRSLSATDLPGPHEGTLEYAAPEQWEPRDCYTEKVDVFAFGLVAYEIIRGYPVVSQARPSRLPEVPASFGSVMQNVIAHCWSLTPSERPSFQAIFNEFKKQGWNILPDVDAKTIAESVAEVNRLEKSLNPSTV
jgi:serine/threonine protein kinase